MYMILSIFSGVLFISVFGIHFLITNGATASRPMYTRDVKLTVIPWISGFVLPVFAWNNFVDLHWAILFFINIALVFTLGITLARMFLTRFNPGKGKEGFAMIYALIAGIVTLVLGGLLK